MIKFYHISRDSSSETVLNYAENGIQPSAGRGYGGQSAGFYCWTSNDSAERYYRSLLAEDDAKWAQEKFGIDIRLKHGEALKIELKVDEKDVRNPVWQLDNEQHAKPKVGRLRSIFLDFWAANKDCFNDTVVNFDISSEKGEKVRVTKLGWNKEKNCPIMEYVTPEGRTAEKYITTTRAEDSHITQAVNDYLCKNNKTYSDNYDSLILAAAENKHSININGQELFTERLAVKYCGEKPLKNIQLSYLQGEITVAPDRNINNPREGDIAHGDSTYRLFYEEKPVNIEMLQKLKGLRNKIEENNVKPPSNSDIPSLEGCKTQAQALNGQKLNMSGIDFNTLKMRQGKRGR